MVYTWTRKQLVREVGMLVPCRGVQCPVCMDLRPESGQMLTCDMYREEIIYCPKCGLKIELILLNRGEAKEEELA